MGVKSHFLFSFGYHSKQAGDERHLPHTVPYFDAAHLPFPDQVHDLIALQGSPRRLILEQHQRSLEQHMQELEQHMALLQQKIARLKEREAQQDTAFHPTHAFGQSETAVSIGESETE